MENGGYGLITSDEGHRFLAFINLKQSKGESERALLCKIWGGKGDRCALSAGERGFDKTSISICNFIQPCPLLSELMYLSSGDGFVDRFTVHLD